MIKKIALYLLVAGTFCYSNFTLANTTETTQPEPRWTGFYLGGNAGYWQSATDKINTTGSPSYINSTYEPGASDIANALAQLATNSFSLNPSGLIGGGQFGYNYATNKGVLFGFDINFDGATNASNSSTLQKTVNLVDYSESYAGSVAVTQKINYLGAVRARLGYLWDPTFLLYVAGGLAYSNVTLDTAWNAQESLGSAVFPPVNAQNNVTQTLTGWTAGGGVEWFFKPRWSAMLEYTYYSLSHLNAPVTLTQTNDSVSPPVVWGSASANTALSLSVAMIRAGINYHF